MNTVVPAIIHAVLICALVIAVITDFRSHKIYNWLTLPTIALGLVLNVLPGGHGLLFSLCGIGVASVALLMFLLGGVLGAADVKLLWAVGALTGPAFTLWTLPCAAIAGGFLALAYAFRRGVVNDAVQNTVVSSHILATTHSADAVAAIPAISKAGKMPYAPAIAVGVAAAFILQHVGVFR